MFKSTPAKSTESMYDALVQMRDDAIDLNTDDSVLKNSLLISINTLTNRIAALDKQVTIRSTLVNDLEITLNNIQVETV